MTKAEDSPELIITTDDFLEMVLMLFIVLFFIIVLYSIFGR